jgi:hypothetical protein
MFSLIGGLGAGLFASISAGGGWTGFWKWLGNGFGVAGEYMDERQQERYNDYIEQQKNDASMMKTLLIVIAGILLLKR